MSDTAKACSICGLDSHQSVLVNTQHEDNASLFCMRCFHGLIHGMQPEQLREKWKAFQAGQA